MNTKSRIIHRLIQLFSVVILFFISPIIVPLSIDLVVMIIVFIKDRKKEILLFDFANFIIAYLLMLLTALLFPAFELLPYTPHFIYPVFLFSTILSLAIKRPITSTQTLKKSFESTRTNDYLVTVVWLVTFLSATFCSFYFFPNSEYMIYSFYSIGGGIAISIIIWILRRLPKHASTVAK